MKIIIFGPQGSGKGTQAELIARRHELPYISTGDIFRYHTKNQTDLGKQVIAYTNAGQLVPDELTNEIVTERLQQPDCVRGFVLDGYPRNSAQQQFLDAMVNIDVAIVIALSDTEAVTRLSGRLACKCGLSYHTEFNPPKQTGICDKCGSELFRRDDDQPEAIKQRLAIYHEQTEPVFEAYRATGKLHEIDGSQSIEEVYNAITTILDSHA